MIIVGLRGQNFPNDMEKALLLNHILKYFGGHTPEEIRLAFEMAVCGQLELSFDEVTSYENFSVIYFSKIMTAYRNWAEVEYRQTIKQEPPKQTIYTQDDLDNLHRGDVENFYQRCRQGIAPNTVPDYYKDILVKDGLMKEDENITAFLVNRLGNASKNIYVK